MCVSSSHFNWALVMLLVLALLPSASALTQAGALRPGWISVTDFGAVGDGKTDDTAAFRQACAAAESGPGKLLFVPAGTYVVQPGLNLTEGVTFFGEGPAHSVLTVPAETQGALLTLRGDRITVRDLTLRGPAADKPLPVNGVDILQGRYLLVERIAVENLTIGVRADSLAGGSGGDFAVRDLRVTNSTFRHGQMSVAFHLCRDVEVSHCSIQGMAHGVSCSSTVGFRCENNVIEDCADSGLRGLVQCDSHVNFNTFRNAGYNGGAAIAIDCSVNYECIGNVVDNSMVRGTGWGFEWEGVSGLVVKGNTLRLPIYGRVSGIWLHGRGGTHALWFTHAGRLTPVAEDPANPLYQRFIGGDSEKTREWQITQPEAVQIAVDTSVAVEGKSSLHVEIQPSAEPGLLAVKPLPPSLQRGFDTVHVELALRGLQANRRISVVWCRDESGLMPARKVFLPGLAEDFRDENAKYRRPKDLPPDDAWHFYHLPVYQQGMGYGRAGYGDQFAAIKSVALYLDEPLAAAENFYLDAVMTAAADNFYRDAGIIIQGNTFYNAFNGITFGNWHRNVQIVDNVFDAKQLARNRGSAAILLFSYHALLRPEDVAAGRAMGKVWADPPVTAPPDWVPADDLLATNPRAEFFENVRIAGNIVDSYQQLIGVSGRDQGRFILREKKVGLVIQNNILSDVEQLFPKGFPKCDVVSGNVEKRYRP